MRVFGSPCWVFNDRESLGKFDARGEAGVFLGYGNNTRTYKVLVKSTGKVIESMNVAVDDARRVSYIDEDGYVSDPDEENPMFANVDTKDLPVIDDSDKR